MAMPESSAFSLSPGCNLNPEVSTLLDLASIVYLVGFAAAVSAVIVINLTQTAILSSVSGIIAHDETSSYFYQGGGGEDFIR